MSELKLYWWWVGLADPRRAKGEQGIGAVIVTAPEEAHAGLQVRAIMGREYDHCELYLGQMPAEHGDPPPAFVGRFLNRREGELLAQTWIPGGRLATAEEIRAAILDDDAHRGDPLFVPRPKVSP